MRTIRGPVVLNLLLPCLLCVAGLAQAQGVWRNSNLDISVTPDPNASNNALFPILKPQNGGQSGSALPAPMLPEPTAPQARTGQRPPLETRDVPRPASGPAYQIQPNHVQPGPTRMTLWFVPSGEQSANTGQLTCRAWARSVLWARSMERLGPFHAAIAPVPFIEELGVRQLLNNTAHVFLGPLASKWDIPIWSVGPPDDPRPTLSGLYYLKNNLKGPTSVVVAWDPQWLVPLQHAWLDGLTASGELDQVQAAGWKQRIGPLRASEPNRVDRMDFDVVQGKVRNIQWRSLDVVAPNQPMGCSG